MTDSPQGRAVPDRLTSRSARAARSWEALLLVVAVAVFVANSFASPYFLNAWNLSDATFNFTEKALIAFPMAMLIIAGDIDLSVASILALASTAMGVVMAAGGDTTLIVLAGLGTGRACGAGNGRRGAGLGRPAIVVTIGTMSLFRGASYVILGDEAFNGYPEAFAWFGQGYAFWVISVELVIFTVAAIAFFVLLHRTSFGRTVYAIGNNPTAALFSGIRVARVRFVLFLMTGVMSGLAAVCLTSRLGATRPAIATGGELEVVTMGVLGGINILGGSGTIPGVVLAAIIMGLVTFGFGLLNVPGIVMSIFLGILLIAVIALPRLWARARGRREG